MTTIVINSEGIFAQLPDGKLVRFEDQEFIKHVLKFQEGKPSDNTVHQTFEVPESYEIVIQWQVKYDDFPWDTITDEQKESFQKERPDWEFRQVAILKRTGEKEVELTCMVCGKPFIGPEPKMCCSGRDCGCMGLPIDPVVCSQECYDKGMNKKPLTPSPVETGEETKEDKRRWPAIRAEEKLIEFRDKVTIIDGKSQFHFGWRKCLEWIDEEYEELVPKGTLKQSSDKLTCYKNCGNTHPSPDGTICLSCGSSIKQQSSEYNRALEDGERAIKELLAQKFGLLNENQFYLLDSKEVIQELQKLKNG